MAAKTIEVRHIQTLVYYDGPQLVVAEDSSEGKYLCVLTEVSENSERFFCAAVSEYRLDAFKSGALDLRQIFAEAAASDLYEGGPTDYENTPSLVLQPAERIPEAWYPLEGFYMPPSE